MSATLAEAAAARQAARAERDERLTGKLFMTDAEVHLRAQNHVECSRAGIVDHAAIRRHGDALVASLRPALEETNLTGPEALQLRQEMARVPSVAAETRHAEFIGTLRTPIYGTAKVVAATAERTKAAAHQSPSLRRALNVGNAANSVPLGRALYRRTVDGESIVRKPVK